MINLNIVMGAAGVGKSTYIQKHRQEGDFVIDVLDYQKRYGLANPYIAFYAFLADIEGAIHQQEAQTIWVENTFLCWFRRKMFLDWFRTLAKGYEVPMKINLICCISSRATDEMLEDPHKYDNDLGWDTIQLYKE